MSLVLVITAAFTVAIGHDLFPKAEERRRLSENLQSCSEVDYSGEVFNCFKFFDETFYNEEFLASICTVPGYTDKSINATLCEEHQGNEEYFKSFKLALVNSMYGNGRAVPTSCRMRCMYDPFNVQGDDAIGFRWVNSNGCWDVIVGEDNNLCYVNRVKWHTNAIHKSENFCPGKICEAYGDPHTYSFDENSVYTEHSIGDFVLFSTDTMRIDVRLRQFIDGKTGLPWGTVSGIHATAIEVTGGECEFKFEIYNQHQIVDGDEMFLFNGEEVTWDELPDRFNACDEICPDLYDLNENQHTLSMVFANKVAVKIQKTWRMHGVWVTAPFESFATDQSLVTDGQLCMEDYRRLDCDNDTTIFTHYDWDIYQNRSITCPEVPEDNSVELVDCDEDIVTFAEEACASCNSECDIEALTVSCSYDICLSPGVAEEWSENNQDVAISNAQEIADQYCEWVESQIEENPWLCRYPTYSPTLYPSTQPTVQPTPSAFYVVQGKQQAECLDSLDDKCTTRAVSQYDIYSIRCCADTDPGGWYQNSDGGCNVFTNSEVPTCQTGDWSTAVEVCSAAGGRLCTREELEYPSQCSAGGLCGFNNYMVWSSTEGSLVAQVDEYYIVQGFSRADCLDTEDSTCSTRGVSKDDRFKVRCCADSDPGGWMQEPGCSVYTESNVPNCVSTDWDSAVELCTAAGGRLCTMVELESDCSKDGGCGFNRHMVWSSTLFSSAE